MQVYGEDNSSIDYHYWVKYAGDVMNTNIQFLKENYEDILYSSIEIATDAINIEAWITPGRELTQEERGKVTSEVIYRYFMHPALYHVVISNAFFLPILVMLGAVPHAFYTLRTMLEAVAIAVYADCKSDLAEFTALEKIEQKCVRNATLFGVKDVLRNIIAERLGQEEVEEWVGYILDLYRALSAWIHPVARIRVEVDELAAGLLRAVFLSITYYEAIPAYGLQVPKLYKKEDLKTLEHLNFLTRLSRLALVLLVYTWFIDKDWVNKEAIKNHFNRLVKKPIRIWSLTSHAWLS